MEYSKLASSQVSSLGGATPVILPFVPNFIEISNSSRAIAVSGVTRAWWMTDMGQGSAFVETTSAGPASGTSFISAATGGGFSTFAGGLSFQYGASLGIASITKASPAVVTTTANHGLVSGNVVIFQGLYQSPTTGMPQIASLPFVVTVTGATTFTIPWNTNQSNYTAISGSPAGAFVKQVLYPFLYYPGVSFISAISLGASTLVTTTAPHNFVVGQEVAFRIPTLWGTTQLNSLPNNVIPGSPIYGFVTVVNSSTQVTVNINSTGYTAYGSNIVFTAVPGLSFPQILAVGDNNTGSNLFNGNSPTINGPVLAGAFLNNTSMGFTIGASVAGTAGDSLYWRAYAHDYNV
jgi:hypothetical protein